MATLIRCCYCRDAMSPIAGEWVSHNDATAQCKHAPDGKHARQIVIQPKKSYTNQ